MCMKRAYVSSLLDYGFDASEFSRMREDLAAFEKDYEEINLIENSEDTE